MNGGSTYMGASLYRSRLGIIIYKPRVLSGGMMASEAEALRTSFHLKMGPVSEYSILPDACVKWIPSPKFFASN